MEEQNKTTTEGQEVKKEETKKPKYNVEVVENKSTLKFENVVGEKATVGDMLQAQKIAGSFEGVDFDLAIISVCCTFDGKSLAFEDLQKLEQADFLELRDSLISAGLVG